MASTTVAKTAKTATATRGREVALGLYRNILRAHKRHLPNEMRLLGDAYLKSEFKLHKAVTNQAQLNQFFTAWEDYLSHISQTGRRNVSVSAGSMEENNKGSSSSSLSSSFAPGFGQNLPHDVELTEEQLAQLEKLREETNKAVKST